MSRFFRDFEQLLKLAQKKAAQQQAPNNPNNSDWIEVSQHSNFSQSESTVKTMRTPRTSGYKPLSPVPHPAPSPEPAVKPSLQAVGGLREVLAELHDLVALPLKRPDLLAKLGLEPTRGVLLIGPPGTGKTLTVRAIAEELGVNYIAIAGPEIIGKYYGEAELRLRQIFQKATLSAPCLIFIDEIDSLAPERTKVEGEVEKRVVAQLLSLMDGFAQLNGVMILAATNCPDRIDPALRRPGRFDREVYFRVPDRLGRLEILKIHTSTMPLDGSVDLAAVADLAVGFVGADLRSLCQKAAYNALHRFNPPLDSPIPEGLSINQQDFLQALKEVKPSILRPVTIETPNITWEEIGGLESVKTILQETVEGALLYPELYRQLKAISPRGILLWGPPGTGKTLLAKAVASQARANFIAINGPELHSKWVGASEQAVRELFTRARQVSPCIIFLDEIDALAPIRGGNEGDFGVSDRLVGQLLTEIDGIQACTNILIIAATNRPDIIDPALLRAGRLDLQLKVDLPDVTSRFEILRVHNCDRPLAADINLAAWAVRTEGWNGAELALLSNQATMQAIRRYRIQGFTHTTEPYIFAIDFEIAYQFLLERRFQS
ncbi:AAA family ATPase [Nostoc sp. ChiSLP03a]|uniref:AAA family ATPase n=1 Tax=Nostoc sp. ChiSLP03a TaxID=3075380 RepID=UPI002AD5A956|nr:AAA family ATPase [Nostoc sp. ChiSLP03a]MDZ8215905.1 AAA family ATPase [Nostoc sp. ChiSLP03a]